MPQFFIGLIAGLAFVTFLPQAALALAIIAAIGLAVAIHEKHRWWQGSLCLATNETTKEGIIMARMLRQRQKEIYQRFLSYETYEEIARDS